MKLSMIVAVSENGVIGKGGGIPWHLSGDLQRFKHHTMGHHLIMGRKTYESIGKALPGRKMVIVTHQEDYQAPDCAVVHSLDEAIELARVGEDDEAFIAGGASLYAEALPLVNRIYFTRVHAEVDGDTFFPVFDGQGWEVIEAVEFPEDLRNDHSFTCFLLERESKS